MFTLTKASRETKIILTWGGAIIGILVLLYILFKFFGFVLNVIFPKAPEKPTFYFGKLTYPSFPKNATDKTFTYSVNTITGNLPILPNIAKIQRIEAPKPDLLALKKIGERVSQVGYKNGPVKISNTLYEWTNDVSEGSSALRKKIKVNILTYNFNATADPYSNPDIVAGKNLPSKEEAVTMAEDFLKEADYLEEGSSSDEEEGGGSEGDIDLTKTQTKIYSLSAGGFTEASSISNTQVIQVIFFQKDIGDIPVIYKTPGLSNIDVFVVGGEFGGQVLGANYIHHTLSDVSSTYTIKTAKEAFEELKKGNAYIASYHGTDDSIAITKVYLAYYFSDKDMQYSMPVVVFEGNDGFFAYVLAVTDEWLKK